MSSYQELARNSRLMCDLEDMAWTSWLIGDRAGVIAAVTGFLHVARHSS